MAATRLMPTEEGQDLIDLTREICDKELRPKVDDAERAAATDESFPTEAVRTLGAAGLLKGYRASTHWTAMDFLSAFGAIPTKTRVCIDRNRVTGGGVTAGIDFALTLVSLLHDRKTAEAIQLRLEYNPAPPFNSGSPDTAPPETGFTVGSSSLGMYRTRTT